MADHKDIHNFSNPQSGEELIFSSAFGKKEPGKPDLPELPQLQADAEYQKLGESIIASFGSLQVAHPEIDLTPEAEALHQYSEQLQKAILSKASGKQIASLAEYIQPQEKTLETAYEPLTAQEKAKLDAAIAEVRFSFDEDEQAQRTIVGMGRKALPYLKSQLIADDEYSADPSDVEYFSRFVGAMAEVDDVKLVLDTLKNPIITAYFDDASENLSHALLRMVYEIRTKDPSDIRLQLISDELVKINQQNFDSDIAQETAQWAWAMTGTPNAQKFFEDSYLFEYTHSLSSTDSGYMRKKLFGWQVEDALLQATLKEASDAHKIDPETGLTKIERATIDLHLKNMFGSHINWKDRQTGEKAIVAIGGKALPYLKKQLLSSDHSMGKMEKFLQFFGTMVDTADLDTTIGLLKEPRIMEQSSYLSLLLQGIQRTTYGIRKEHPHDERLDTISTALVGWLTETKAQNNFTYSYYYVLRALSLTGTEIAKNYLKNESSVSADTLLTCADYLASLTHVPYSSIRIAGFEWKDDPDPYLEAFQPKASPPQEATHHEFTDTLTDEQRMTIDSHIKALLREDGYHHTAERAIIKFGREALPHLKKVLLDSPKAFRDGVRHEQLTKLVHRLAEEDDALLVLDIMAALPDPDNKLKYALARGIYDIRLGNPNDARLSTISHALITQIQKQNHPSKSYALLAPLGLTGTKEAKSFLEQVDFLPDALLQDPQLHNRSLVDIPKEYIIKPLAMGEQSTKTIKRTEKDAKDVYTAWIKKDERTGQLVYARFYHDPNRARLTVLADRFYRRFGIKAPESVLQEIDGQLAYVSQQVPGVGLHPEDASEMQKLQNGFVLDAFLGNADVLGKKVQHIEIQPDGKLYRMENGNALTRSSQGFNKDIVTELSSMRFAGLNPEAAAVFGGISEEKMQEQARMIIRRLSSKDIERIVKQAGLPETLTETLTKRLIGRREYLRQRFHLSEPEAKSPDQVKESAIKKTETVVQRLSEQSAAEQLEARFATVTLLGDSDKIEGHLIDFIERRFSEEDPEGEAIQMVASFKVTEHMYAKILEEIIPDLPGDEVQQRKFSFVFADGDTMELGYALEISCDETTKIHIADKRGDEDHEGNPVRSLWGTVNIEVTGVTDVKTLTEKIQQAFSLLGITEALVDPDHEAERVYKENRFRWHHRLEDDDEKYDAYKTGLAQQGIPDILSHLAREEVFPGYYTFVDHGASERYAQEGAYFLFRTSRKARRLPNVLREGFLSSNERYKRGMNIYGMSTDEDFMKGGADSVFLRIFTGATQDDDIRWQQNYGQFLFILNPKLLDRTDWYAYHTDEFGTLEPGKFNDRPSPDGFIRQQRLAYQKSNEIMLRRGVPPDGIMGIAAFQSEYRDDAILHLRNAGIHEVNGVPIDDFVHMFTTAEGLFARYAGKK